MAERNHSTFVLQRNNFDELITALQHQGYTVLGPVARDGAITYDEITSSGELPIGYTDEHSPGKYRLSKGTTPSLFGYVVGPYSWKKFIFPPVFKTVKVKRSGNTFDTNSDTVAPIPRYAFLGVRPCELHALAIQDKVFCSGKYIDPDYKEAREKAILIAVNCTRAGGTCFCASMNTGPKATKGFDLALTEIINGKEHFFTVEAGSDRGTSILKELSLNPAERKSIDEADLQIRNAANHMGKMLNTTTLPQVIQENFEHRRWEETAKRCLSCANCTMVCPTCFCTTVEDVTDLTGEHAERIRKWDSCFTTDFSYIHGGSIRPSVKSRYRQWMSHKLANWVNQFGTSGCVGCGRCITWCPAGIDITEEARILQQTTKTESSTLSV